MSEYIIENINDFKELDAGTDYIVLFGVDKVPPHIGFVTKLRYYSKSSQGGKRNHDFNNVLSSIQRKKIPTLLLKLKSNNVSPESFFDNQPLNTGESCLTPIKLMLTANGVSVKDAEFIFDLINLLYKRNELERVEQINCAGLIQANMIKLAKYSQKEINNAIQDSKRPC